jgi:hypothetical protein
MCVQTNLFQCLSVLHRFCTDWYLVVLRENEFSSSVIMAVVSAAVTVHCKAVL